MHSSSSIITTLEEEEKKPPAHLHQYHHHLHQQSVEDVGSATSSATLLLLDTSAATWMMPSSTTHPQISEISGNECAACAQPILDRYVFTVLGKCWHQSCLRCCDCRAPMSMTCFSKDGLILCKTDYSRRYGHRCAGCDGKLEKEDLYVKGSWIRVIRIPVSCTCSHRSHHSFTPTCHSKCCAPQH
ncbi:hypothetical protein L5515_001483 [Caenorhabditis briggsae]|uniref:LIM zinc-binding domain-containing protein n=1 Tax=Caenorhabditis briggsae TaxID=6238 RepID=A0AAE9J3H3_CAEBR|nr:hypothetical protein L5515_001483 [Caenorhabditis briggsae]